MLKCSSARSACTIEYLALTCHILRGHCAHDRRAGIYIHTYIHTYTYCDQSPTVHAQTRPCQVIDNFDKKSCRGTSEQSKWQVLACVRFRIVCVMRANSVERLTEPVRTHPDQNVSTNVAGLQILQRRL